MKIEKIITVVFIIGLLFRFQDWPGGSLTLILSLTTLSLLYFVAAFYVFSDKTLKQQNLALSIASGVFLSIAPLGILFKLKHWPGAAVLLFVGTIVSIVILFFVLILKPRSPGNLAVYYRNMVIRTTVLGAICLLLFFTPISILLKLQFGNDPELIRLKTQYYHYPDNIDYKREHDEYMNKLDSLKAYGINQ